MKIKPISPPLAYSYEQALQCVHTDLHELMASATAYREYYFSKNIELCAIINARSGHCNMNCAFCAQSKYNHSKIDTFPMLEPTALRERLAILFDHPVSRVGIVTSGGALSVNDVQSVITVLHSAPKNWKGRICASLGRLQVAEFEALREAGLRRYHHNLECSEDYYASICSTQTWSERENTLRRAQAVNLQLCSGGLFGLGESFEDRIALAFALKQRGVNNIPINFLQAIEGTPLANAPQLKAEEALRIIAIFRHILPSATLRICGGRFHVFGQKQELIFAAGANALMTGNYLTTKGQGIAEDCQMIERQGLIVNVGIESR